MPVADYKTYCKLLDEAKKKHYAFPAFNVTSYSSANAALMGLAESRSDGIIQVSTGGGLFISGQSVKDMALGAISLASHVHLVAEKYGIYIALHTDHCLVDKLDLFVKPLIEETKKRRKKGLPNLFNAHMFDGSTMTLKDNLKLSKELLKTCHDNEILLEIEIGAVGGEEDDVKAEKGAKLYTNNDDMLAVASQLGLGENGRYFLAATFGNVHGVYNPGVVKLKPEILKNGQTAVGKKYNKTNPFDLVFHGGSGSNLEDIHQTLEYGVVKMNVDTDCQYAFSRPIAEHFFTNYDSVLKVDGNVGNKKYYDPRSYLKKAEDEMKQEVIKACRKLKSYGKTLFS